MVTADSNISDTNSSDPLPAVSDTTDKATPSGSVIIENDIELIPKALISTFGDTDKRRGRTLEKTGRKSRPSSVSADMRPIVRYFSPVGKRKANGPAASPDSETATKFSKTDESEVIINSSKTASKVEVSVPGDAHS